MKQHSILTLLGMIAAALSAAAGNAKAINIGNLTGIWKNDYGNFIEIDRSGPGAVATMLSSSGRNNWARGPIEISGNQLVLTKKLGHRTVGQIRGEFSNRLGGPRIHWNSGSIWRKSSARDYHAAVQRESNTQSAGYAVPYRECHGRWQSTDDAVIEVIQSGDSLSVRVISRRGGGGPRHIPWTSANGHISDSRLSLNCYHGTTLVERVTGTISKRGGVGSIIWSNGQTWQRRPNDFRVITEPIGTIGRLPIDVIDTAIPGRPLPVWQSSHGGYFHLDGTRWYEYGSDGRRLHQYRETHRTEVSVTIQDDRRGVSVHLRKDECWLRQRGSDDWRRLYGGRWSSSPPGRRHLPSRHKGPAHGQYSRSPHGHEHAHGYEPERESVRVDVQLGSFLRGLFGGGR